MPLDEPVTSTTLPLRSTGAVCLAAAARRRKKGARRGVPILGRADDMDRAVPRAAVARRLEVTHDMGRRLVLSAALPVAVAGVCLGAFGASAGSAGKPVATRALLCGLWMNGTDRMSGQSSIDHPAGAASMGQYYAYTGQTCESEYNGNGGFNSGSQTFMWTVNHSNVNVDSERGTEHGLFTLSGSGTLGAGFNGHITNFDFGSTPDSNGNRQIWYASGHAYDPSTSPSGPGNFNTHGGASSGQHFRGTYGTIVYQDSNNSNSPCQTGSANFCFEAILIGFTN
jgi:hypothetical protein